MQTSKTDQTGHITRLIRVFADHTGDFVGFVLRWLKCKCFRGFHFVYMSQVMTNLFMLYGNKCADQPVHLQSLISTFVIPCLQVISNASAHHISVISGKPALAQVI